MLSHTLLFSLLGSTLVQAIPFPNFTRIKDLFPRQDSDDNSGRGGGRGNCPAIWTTITADLTAIFLDQSTGECTDAARSAIRAAFHDAGTFSRNLPSVAPASGGADGSLILAQEYNRRENRGLENISTKLLALALERNVGVADMIQFAGAHAIVTCPNGPVVKTYVGRTDSSTPAPDGLLPDGRAPADSLLALFQDKGFDAKELAALMGAHTCSRQFFVNATLAGQPQDSTPGIWDVKFYSETFNPPPGVFVLRSDRALSQHVDVGKEFRGYIDNQGKWASDFAPAMTKMSVLGLPEGTKGLTDCTNALPKKTSKRDIKAAPINARAYHSYHGY